MSDAAAIDWGDGDYAPTADALAPAAAVVLDAVDLQPGERLIDVGCGTGNALLEAARRGAEAVGFDPSPRLVAAAAARLSAERLSGEVCVGTAEWPPPGMRRGDAVVSVFAVIFAADPATAIAGMIGLVRPGGRLALSSWLPGGAIGEAGRVLRAAVSAGSGAEAPPPRWQEPAWIAGLLEEAGARDVVCAEHELVFRHDSPEAWFAEQEAGHPVWRAVRAHLDDDAWIAVRDRSITALREGNEDPAGFAVTSSYVVVSAAR